MQTLARAGCLVLCAAASSSWGQIYVGGDRDAPGGVVLSNHPSAATPTLLLVAEMPADGGVAPPPLATASLRTDARRQPTPAVAAVIGSMAREYDVAEALVKAVIAVESGFEPSARSRKGAMGLMQLMPETARRFGARDAYAPEDNVRAGTAYLRWLLDYFAGDLELVLAAYNAGENAVVRAGRRVPDIAETRAYVPKVLSYLAHYRDGTTLPR
jgi:soluble lytic murein transglycosylase-like protein